ncbi:PucR family transcriptional regulator [Pseudonocardia nantongensis]|uniref:PucR family transcriptional regulator n=1 Tax=Pseudonocardia nantongensis TaxID=1181885 RepID=UPI00397C8031
MHSTEGRADEGPVAGEPADARWEELVTRLRGDSDALFRAFLARVRLVPPYARGLVPTERMEDDATRTFDYLLRRIGDTPVPARLAEIGTEIGRDRAHRGVPLNDLLTAVRLNFRIVWDALREQAGTGDGPLLVERVDRVWAAVEEHALQVQVAYQDEGALIARERRGERSMLVAALLDRVDGPDDVLPDPGPDEVARVARALAVDVDDDLLVVVAPASAGGQLHRAAATLAAQGRPVHVQALARHAVLLARWTGAAAEQGPAGIRALRSGLGGLLDTVPCVLGPPAHGVPTVPASARTALRAVDALPDLTGPVDPYDAWLPVAAAGLSGARGIGPELVSSVLGGLGTLAPAERDRLLDTVRAWARTGSVTAVARELWCHRNTVLNRLRRCTELTGRDVTVPDQATVLLLALACSDVPSPGRR